MDNSSDTDYQQKQKQHSQWASGVSGNYHGRPRSLPDIQKTIRKEIASRNAAGYSAMDIVVATLFDNAVLGDTEACIKLIDLAYPKSTNQRHL